MISLEKENDLVLDLVQAMLGSVTPNFRAVFMKNTPNGFLITFLLEWESAEDREEIEEIRFELAALQDASGTVDFEIVVDSSPMAIPPDYKRIVFARKE